MKFAPEYVNSVLTDNFEDAKTLFLGPLLSIHYAHLVMLAEQGILCTADARTLRAALDGIDPAQVLGIRYDGTYEDLFFYLDRLIAQAAGDTVAGRLHTARSRNDIDMTMYRMRQREFVLDLLDATLALRDTWLRIASAHRETIFPAHTHTQPAQPTTVAHYLLGAIEQLERDAVRLRAAFEVTNVNPLGACAITGTGFPINRDRTSELLGFSGPTGNTYGSIGTVDYLLQNLSAAAVTLVGVGRVVQDLLLWCTAEVRYLRLPDGFVQSSSIMPQKRNPVALEHARSIGSKALGQASAVFLSVHNTPFGDIVDTEDDLQPLVHATFRDATRAIALVAAALRDAELDVERMQRRAEEGWITVTELADTLVRDHGIPFGAGHSIAAKLIERIRRDPEAIKVLAVVLTDVSKEVTGRALVYDAARLREILSPAHFVEIRKTLGGPSPSVTGAAIDASRALLDRDRVWLAGTRAKLASAASTLRTEVDGL
jgi:argininosuccinate lyase